MFYISSSCLSYKRISESVLTLVNAGIKNIELSGGTEYYKGLEDDLLDLKERYGINFLIHNYFPPPEEEFVINLAVSEENERQKIFEHIKKAVTLSNKLGINTYSIHAGFTINLLPLLRGLPLTMNEGQAKDKQDAVVAFYANLDFIVENMCDSSFRFAVENNRTFVDAKDCSLVCSPAEIFEFLNYYRGNQNMGFLLDLGHLNIASSMLLFEKFEFIEELFSRYGDKIFELHLSENDGLNDIHDILSEDSWQLAVLREYSDFIKNIPVVFEWRNSRLEDIITQYNTLIPVIS